MSPTEGIPEVVAAAKVQDAVDTMDISLDSKVAQKVVSQVKHYFSDANLNHDVFMRKGVSENDGWVQFSTLIRFNKLRQLVGVPTDPKDSNDSKKNAGKRGTKGTGARPAPIEKKFVDLLAATVAAGVGAEDSVEVSETAIRRKDAYVESDAWFERTVHVKGLPYGEERAETIEELTEFFAKHGSVLLLRLRRNPKTKAFKGNVLVEFATAEQAEAVAKMEDLEFEGHTLAPTMLSAYLDEKMAGGEYIHPELRKPGETYQSYEEWCLANGRKVSPLPGSKGKDGKAPAVERKEFEITPGMLVKFTGVEGEIGIKELKQAFAVAGSVKFIDIEAGASEGIVRFKDAIAEQVIEAHPEGLAVEDSSVVLKLAPVDEDAEKAFYERAKAASENAAARGNSNNNSGKRSGRHDGGQRRSKRFRN
ncbi:hypothetical protein GGI20_004214 [Coemansia sp. BCRC 34301]|nr:hypothetical protein GGI20_004214 [Coemansia sp. BCRC 34301]